MVQIISRTKKFHACHRAFHRKDNTTMTRIEDGRCLISIEDCDVKAKTELDTTMENKYQSARNSAAHQRKIPATLKDRRMQIER